MFRKEVLVIATDGDLATVTAGRQTACSSCQSRKGCEVQSCGQGQQDLLLEANNPLGVEPGRMVVLEMQERQLLKSAFLVYILPLMVFLAVAIGAEALQESVGPGRSDLVTALAGISGMAGAFLWLKRYDRRRKDDARSRPTIVDTAA